MSSCDPCQVAARVKTEDGEEQWILAEVHSYNSHNHRYIVDDIDEEGHNEQRWEGGGGGVGRWGV